MRPTLKNKIILITILILIFLATVVGKNSHECTASDFSPLNPVEKTYSSFTKESACQKAYAMCTYFSSTPENCKIKE